MLCRRIRTELIDGVLYDMAAPTGIHQVGGEIYAVLRGYIRSRKGHCLPMYSPIDVQLDGDDKTIVQPDVLVLCDAADCLEIRFWEHRIWLWRYYQKSPEKRICL